MTATLEPPRVRETLDTVAGEALAGRVLPTRKDEHWRFTNLRGLDLSEYDAEAGARVDITAPALPEGAFVMPLAEAVERHPELVAAHQGSLVSDTGSVDDYFVALAEATDAETLVLYVPKGATVAEPVRVSVAHAADGGAVNWRLLVVLDEGATASVIEAFTSDDGADDGFSNAIIELVLGRGARLGYVTTQEYARGVWHFATHRARVGQDASLDWTVLGTGGRGGKCRMEVELAGQGAEAKLTGAYFVDGNQAVDYDTLQVHAAPNAMSDLSFKGVLTERGRSVWRGMIEVAPGAQGTDAYQDNRNLMLSADAHADSIPGLQIEANEVRCTHGSTIGRVDPEQLFYLRARGLSTAQATRLLVDAFLVPVLDRIQQDDVREALRESLDRRLTAALSVGSA